MTSESCAMMKFAGKKNPPWERFLYLLYLKIGNFANPFRISVDADAT